MAEPSDCRIVVEVATPETVKRLEDDNAALKQQLDILRGQHERLHQTVYRLMEKVADLVRSKGKS